MDHPNVSNSYLLRDVHEDPQVVKYVPSQVFTQGSSNFLLSILHNKSTMPLAIGNVFWSYLLPSPGHFSNGLVKVRFEVLFSIFNVRDEL